jgi:serine/threonine-protein phosphatase 2A regulatory subunit A
MSSVLPSPSIQMARSLGNVSSEEVHQMSAWDLFTSQMESGSTEAATDAMKKLRVVCVLGGPEHTRTVIIPYLTSLLNDNNGGLSDELSLILGQQISTILPILSDEALLDILPILEKLACTEETVVRDQAVLVMNEVSARTGQSPAAAAMIPAHVALVKRLASADWFTAKVSAAGIFASIFQLAQHSQSQQFELLTLYKELIADETPMVRRAAAQHLGKTIQAAGWNFRDFGATAVTALAKDEQDSVRLLAVASLAHVGDEFGQHPTWTVQHWLPILKDGTTDMSWYVRFSSIVGILLIIFFLENDNSFF